MKLIYISGSGRSGSTLLERALHASGQAFSMGEAHVLWRLPPERITCSCGRKLPGCEVWQAILARFGPHIDEMAALEARVSRSGFLRAKGFDPARVIGDPRVARFLSLQRRLFDTVVAVSGEEILIDSSKAGPRAFLLSCLDEVSVLHLWREPGDVIASWRSRKFDRGLGADMARLSPGRATLDWMKAEFLVRRIARSRPVTFLNYEGFCAAPRETLERIGAATGIPTGGIVWSGPDAFQPRPRYHSLNGNPDRFANGPVTVAFRAVDRKVLSARDRVAARVLGAVAQGLFPAR